MTPCFKDGGEVSCLECGRLCDAHYEAPGHPNSGFLCVTCAAAAIIAKVQQEEREPKCECGAPIDQIRLFEADSTEPHGETFHDEWHECIRCGARYTSEEMRQL